MSKFRILLVDDEDDFRDTLRDRLKMRGYAVEGAPTGEKGLETFKSQEFDVVVLDIRMPEMDGLKCLKKMKTMKPPVEVILLTGHGTVQSGIDGMQLGAFDYLLKPVPMDELLEKIDLAYEQRVSHEKQG